MKKLLSLALSCFLFGNVFAQTPTLEQVTNAGATSTHAISLSNDFLFTNNFLGIHFQHGGHTRWYLRHDVAETGSNSGSDFSIRSYDDNGAFLRQNFIINRATGVTTIDGDLFTQQITGRNLTFKEADYVGMLGRGGSLTSGWNAIPDAYTLTYFKRDFAIGGWRKSDGVWNGAAFYINSDNGNVLINKVTQTNDTYKLDVAGKVRADKVVVNTTGADFVFDSSYSLMPLPALGKYVKEHRHLPGIQPATVMQQEGLDVGDNQTKLLQKVEELTLYLLDLNKKLDAQQEVIEAQAKQLKELKRQQPAK